MASSKKKAKPKKQTKKKTRLSARKSVNQKKPKTTKPGDSGSIDTLTLALYVISFILLVFGAWYHKINWILLAFVPFIVGLWYENMRHNV